MSDWSHPGPHTVIAIYRLRAGAEEEFLGLLRRHHPTLLRLGLVTEEPPVVYVGDEHDGGRIAFEIFTWKEASSADTAHQLPDVMRIWEGMGALVEEREGRPGFEFPHVTRRSLAPA